MHQKQRLEIIVEHMAQERAGRVLRQAGFKGYTVLPALSGFGGGHEWRRGSDISRASEMVVMVAIGDASVVAAALGELHRLLDQHIGVLNVSTVEVMRPERF
jgi:PII-like signaling protein